VIEDLLAQMESVVRSVPLALKVPLALLASAVLSVLLDLLERSAL
jgi:hypothetical protein